MRFATKSKTDNKIHQQKRGTCVGFACINAFEKAIFRKRYALVFDIRIRSGDPAIKLDNNNILVVKDGKIKGFHATHCLGKWLGSFRKFKGFHIENSWSERWGDNGTFYLKFKDFFSEVHDVYLIEFGKA